MTKPEEAESGSNTVEPVVSWDLIREQARMELFKSVYIQWAPKVKDYTGNVANEQALLAVRSFDNKFKSS